MNSNAAITKPGAYDITSSVYHSNCTPTPALSSSGARTIVNDCPAIFWHESVLNPNRVQKQKREFDLGTACHFMMLEPHLFDERTTVVPYENYRKDAAQALRESAYDQGLTPLLPKELEMVKAMREVLFSHPIAKQAFVGGVPERSYFWFDKEFGVWRKARPDYEPANPVSYGLDYKSSGSANPREFQRRIADLGYHMQAAWSLDAIEETYGTRPPRFCFLVQATKPPYLVSPCWVDADSLLWGAAENRKALYKFARCLEDDVWPGYEEAGTGIEAHTVGLPAWKKIQLEADAGNGAFPPGTVEYLAQLGERMRVAA